MKTTLINEEKQAISLLSKKYSVVLKENIKEKTILEIKQWEKDISKKLNLDNPYYENQKALKRAQLELCKNDISINSIKNDFKGFQDLDIISKTNLDKVFWEKEIDKLEALNKRQENVTTLKIVKKKKEEKNLKEESKACRTLLQNQWQKSLDKSYLQWELAEIEAYRKELLNKLKEWLKLVQEMDDLLSSLSIDTGVLFDLSKGNISLSDIQQLKRWAEYISKDDGVKQLCDMFGQLRRVEQTSRQEKIKVSKIITEYIPDINSNEEIVGLKLGRDIEHVLPQELALMADEETSILFDIKYIEGRLMSFDMQGMQENTIEVEEEKIVTVSEQEKMGPIIICVDTSGSMSGSPETIAKAITLYMATRAKQQKRNCLLINFSTNIKVLDLSDEMGLENVIQFLRMSFNGGTDVNPALEYALKMMKEKEYEKADLLVISDFIMSSLATELDKKIHLAKKKNNKFYSLGIGNLFLNSRFKSLFNEEWVYNPDSSSIHSIKSIVDIISNKQ